MVVERVRISKENDGRGNGGKDACLNLKKGPPHPKMRRYSGRSVFLFTCADAQVNACVCLFISFRVCLCASVRGADLLSLSVGRICFIKI